MIRPVWKLALPALAAMLILVPAYAADEGGKENKKMALIHLLVRAGKNEEAANAMRALYPKGPPPGAAAVEYYRIVGNSASGWEEARRGLEKLSRTEPDNADYQLALGQILAMRPATRHAGTRIFAALTKRPHADRQQVLQAWQTALSRLDNSPDSVELYQEYLAVDSGNPDVRNALAAARRAELQRLPWQLRDKADAQLAAGHPEEAAATLKYALQLDPKNAWVRFDLSRLYHKQGDKKQGRALMEEGLSIAPGDADMLYANALYVGLLDEADNALRLLDKIPSSARSPAMQRLRQKMAIQAQTQHAQAYARDGRHAEMQAAMEHAEAGADSDAELVTIVANAWIELQNSARGVALMQRLASRPSASIATRLYYAEILNRAERDDDEAAVLRALSASRGLSAKDKEDLRYLKASLAARRADNARHAGDLPAARAVLATALEQDPENTDLLMALARVHSSAHEPQKASEIYRRVLRRTPGHMGARLALGWSLNEAGDKAAAQKEMEAVLASAPADDIDTRMSVADWYVGAGDLAAARAIVEPLRKISPDNPRVLVMSGRIAKADGDYSDAMDYFMRAKATDEIADMEKRRATGYVATGVDFLSRLDGVPGISDIQAIEIPVEMRLPTGYGGGLAFVQIDPVWANAGTLQLSDTANLNQYGKVLACTPPNGLQCATVGATSISQSAQGTALAVGYEDNGMRADIGTTPLGFPVSNVVGGVKWSHYTETTGFSLDLSRRPLTNSLLSYAGAHDPVTGEVWGGVTSSGASLHLSRDRGPLSGFVDLAYYWLTGQNVLSNTEAALRTGFDWSFIREDDMRLTGGLAFTAWHYREDLRYYTFGQGGYYSPQRYDSLGIPVRWTGREEHWSYLLQGSVSHSVSYEKAMPYYPDASFQPGINPIYPGGSSNGNGYSLTGAVEYQFSPQLFGGGRFEIDRSAYYAPNYAIFYLRYLFEAYTGAMPYPPSPVKPYSRF
jgi:predicted Zn-dependent protease